MVWEETHVGTGVRNILPQTVETAATEEGRIDSPLRLGPLGASSQRREGSQLGDPTVTHALCSAVATDPGDSLNKTSLPTHVLPRARRGFLLTEETNKTEGEMIVTG